MTTETTRYIKTVTTYANLKGLDFVTAAREYNDLNKSTFDHLFNCYSHLRSKEARSKAIRAIGTEVYNRINANQNSVK